MMKVRILHDLPTTIDGKKIGPFSAGQEVELDDALAAVFIGSAMAEEVLPEPEPATEDADDLVEVQPIGQSEPVKVARSKKAD
jgi:hypothetical protein